MLQKKQQQEFEALLQRGARGRDELERKRVTDTSRRSMRLSNIVAVSGKRQYRDILQRREFWSHTHTVQAFSHCRAGNLAVSLVTRKWSRPSKQLQHTAQLVSES